MHADVVSDGVGGQVLHRIAHEHLPDDGSGLDHGSLVPRQPVETGGEERLDRRRHGRPLDPARRAPAPVLEADEPLVDEHREQLLDEERVSLGRLDDSCSHALVEARASEEMLRDGARVLCRERLELDAACSVRRRPFGHPLDELPPGRADDEKGRVAVRHDVLDELEQGRLGPVDVVEDEDERPVRSELLEELAGGPRQVLHRERLLREPDRRLHARNHVGVADERAELPARLLGGVFLDDRRGLAHRLSERPERDPVAVREAPAADDGGLVRGRSHELLDESRLADTCLADHGHETAASRGDRVAQRPLEHLELGLAADHRRIEAARALAALAHGDQPVRRDRLRLSLELERLDLLDVDVVPDEPVGEVSEQYLVLAGRLLEPRRDVHGVARDEALPRRRVARDDLTRVHARAVREADAPRVLELFVQLLERPLHARRPHGPRVRRRPHGAAEGRRPPSRRPR